ncbi:MAG: hypothetical protein ABI261_09520, partial [Ginsengibacter sp.]
MRNLLKQPCIFKPSFSRAASKNKSQKQFYLRELIMGIVLCFGGDLDFDFSIGKNTAAKAAVTFHPNGISTKKGKSLAPLLTSPSDYFRSRQSGNWSLTSTWESSPDNINWELATEAPTKDANAIIIGSAHTVSVSNSVSLDQTIIQGKLELQTGGVLNINDGVGDDINILGNGILQVTSIGKYEDAIHQSSGASINIATNGKIILGNGIASIGAGYEGFATS